MYEIKGQTELITVLTRSHINGDSHDYSDDSCDCNMELSSLYKYKKNKSCTERVMDRLVCTLVSTQAHNLKRCPIIHL